MIKKINKFKIVIILLLIIVLSLGVFTLAKFVKLDFHSYFLNAKNFYFTSNRLKKDNAIYLVNNWSGVGSFEISFDLLSEKNSYVYAEYDIPYQVTYVCPNDVICSLDKSTGTIYSASTTHSDTVTLSVNPTRSYSENERLVIHIVAKSTSPYQEEISADFEYVVGKQGITYSIDDEANRPYLIFKVTNAINYCTVTEAFGTYSVNDLIPNEVYRTLSDSDKAKCVGEDINISFDPNNIFIDTTDNLIDSSTYTVTTISGTDYLNSLNFNIEPVSTIAIKFYKVNPSLNYTYPYENTTSIIGVSY